MKKGISNQINQSSQHANGGRRNVVNSASNELNKYESGDSAAISNGSESELKFESAVIPLSDVDQQKLLLSASLVIDIFSNPSIAREFAENPSAYMEKRDLSYEGDLDYGIIQMALAFADDGIRQAILNHDIKEFITRCHAQGLLAVPISMDCADSKEITQLLKRIGLTKRGEIIQNEGIIVEVILAVFAVAVLNTAAVVNVIANVNVGININVLANTDTVTSGSKSPTGISDLVLSPITLWAIMNEDIESSYIVLNEIANDYYTQIDTYLANHSTEYATNEEYKNRLQVLIKANLIKYLMQ